MAVENSSTSSFAMQRGMEKTKQYGIDVSDAPVPSVSSKPTPTEVMAAEPEFTPQDAEAEVEDYLRSETPAGQELTSMKEELRVEKELEVSAETQALIGEMGPAAPNPDVYDMTRAVQPQEDTYPAHEDSDWMRYDNRGRRVHQREDGSWDIDNSLIKPRTVEVAGYDLATGEMVRNVLPNAGEHIHSALSKLRHGKINSGGQPFIEDVLPLTQLAYEFQRHDMGFEEFTSNMPESFTRDQLAHAYRMANDYISANNWAGDQQRQWKIDRQTARTEEERDRANAINMTYGREVVNMPPPFNARNVPLVFGEDDPDASYKASRAERKESALNVKMAAVPGENWQLDDQTLRENQVWMNSARVMYRELEGEEFTGTDEELHEKAKEMMALFNWSIYNMGDITRQVMNGPDEMKRSMYYMMTLYDQKITDGEDVVNSLVAVGADPFTYLSLGFGKLAMKGAQATARKELSKNLAKYVGAVGAGSGEGAAYVSYDDFNRQAVKVEAGAQEEWDKAQTAKAAGTGAVIGAVAAPVMVYGGEKAIKYGKKMLENARSVERRTPVPGSPAAQRGSLDLRDKPTADEVAGKGVSAIDIIDQDVAPFKPNPSDIRSPNKQVGEYLQKRADKALGGRNVAEHTPENVEFVADVLAREVKAEVLKDKQKGRAPSAIWYKETLDNARAEVGRIHPEVVSDPDHRTAFDFAMAITSNGQKVSDNSRYSLQAYEYWKATGRMPEHMGWGKEAGAMKGHFATYNELLDAWGQEALFKNLATEFDVRTMKDMGFKVADEAAGAKLPLSVIFGSKIGGGFFSNLQGDFGRLTPDRWFARTWGRVTGTMMKPNPELATKHYADFRANYVANKKLIAEYLGEAPKVGDLTDEKIDEMGQQIFAKWSRSKGPDGKAFPDKNNPIHKLSRAIDNRLTPKEAPAGTKEREMMRATTARVRDKLAADGIDLNISDIQATLWYPEQRLWDQLGSKQTGKENDYERAFRELIGADSRAAGRGRPEGVRQAGAETGLAGREKGTFAKRETLRNLRAGPRGRHSKEPSGNVFGSAAGGTRTLQLGDSSAKVTKVHKPTKAASNRLKNINVSSDPWNELEPGLASSQSFEKAITAAKKAIGKDGAAVYVYDPGELASARLFVSDDGLSGFAIKPDGDIVSVFNANKERRNAAISGLLLAVENGGTKLDAFDTALPHIYSQAGFKVVRREKWNEAYKPEGWDFDNFKSYNNGRPDIVYMEYDPRSSGRYTPGEGSYD